MGQPSDQLMDLVFFALDHGTSSVSEGGPLIAFLISQTADGRQLNRYVSETLEESVALARKAADDLDETTTAYAIAHDGFITVEGHKWDAILVEAAERSADSGFIFAQRYKPKKKLFGKFEIVGNAAFVGETTQRYE